jgi:hypothetical protein
VPVSAERIRVLAPQAALWEDRVGELLAARMRGCADPAVDEYVARLRDGHGLEVAAILFYGSCLHAGTRRSTSFPDFYLLTDDPLRYHRSLAQAALGQLLPPSVYYRTFARPGAEPLRCKLCVLTVEQFRAETSAAASDVHHLGRFSKRFALAYARDEATARQVIEGALSSMLVLLPHSLALLPERFSLEELVLAQLGLSYLGEQRVAEPDKVEGLYRAERDHYLELHQLLLALHAARAGTPLPDGDGRYRQPPPTARERARTLAFLRRSRIRGVLRWPKYMLTVENWLEYILDKLERQQGVRLELTARERRHPLIFGWPRLWELLRRGIVR